MKKVLAIVMAAMLVMALGACSKDELSAYQIYTQANEKLSKAGSMSADIVSTITMTAQGEEIDISVKGNVKEVTKSETEADMEMDLTMSMMGMDIPTYMYYTDGYIYMDMMDQKVKVAASAGDASYTGSLDVSFAEKDIKDVKVEELEGGGHAITFSLDGVALSDILAQQVKNSMSNMGGAGASLEGMEVEIGDVHMEVDVNKDGSLQRLLMDYPMTMTMEGESVEAKAHIEMNDIVEGGVTIEFPDDLDTYTEQDISAAA